MSPHSRRDALRLGSLGIGASLAGCLGDVPGFGPVDLGGPERTDHSGSTAFEFFRDGERLLGFTVLYPTGYRAETGELRFELEAWHADGTHLDGLNYHIWMSLGDGSYVEYYLRTPGGFPWPNLHFQRDRNGAGIHLDVPDLGEQGGATVRFDLVADIHEKPANLPETIPLAVDAELALSEEGFAGRDYRASAGGTVEIPREPSDS